MHTFACRSARTTAVDINLVRDNKGRVEAHTKLTNQVRVFFLITRKVLHEVGCTGFGDGSQMGDHIVTVHTDTVVFERDGVSVLVEAHTDF